MQCNIDARGKALRLKIGLLHLFAALVLALLCLTGFLAAGGWWLLVLGVAAAGAFVVFEARSGWCVVRAMGFKTPF